MKRTRLTGSTPLVRSSELRRQTPLRPVPPRSPQQPSLKRTPLGRTTLEQKQRVGGRACIVCAEHGGRCHPAHVVPRSHPKMSEEAANDLRAVVPLCPTHHRAFDEGRLDLLPYLEPGWRDSQEWAAGAVGLASAMRTITGGAA